jgi:D-alanyl-D-alanine carboxypeptidase
MNRTARVTATLLAGAVVVLSCRPAPESRLATIARDLQALVTAAVDGHQNDFGAALHVDSPVLGLNWEGAAGVADPATGEPMAAALPVLVASNTKTFISASILILQEEGRLDIDDPIATHLPDEYVALLRSDGYDPQAITIRHLLTHTGGLFDFADTDIYTEEILADPQHRWTRTEQLESAMAWGDPYGAPGEVYRYCDTGYILLGEILEQVTGRSMPVTVRDLVGYERLGLDSTWFETLEPRPDGVPDLAHQFWAGIDVTTIDPSQDLYGGGGLASTVGDLARFFRGAFTGAVFADSATIDIMLTTLEVDRAGPDYFGSELSAGPYRMGVKVSEVAGYTVYSHGGFFGTVGAYVPDLDLALGATVNRTESHDALDALVEGSIRVVATARP